MGLIHQGYIALLASLPVRSTTAQYTPVRVRLIGECASFLRETWGGQNPRRDLQQHLLFAGSRSGLPSTQTERFDEPGQIALLLIDREVLATRSDASYSNDR